MSKVRVGIDLTACWRARVGMVTVALELARSISRQPEVVMTLFASQGRPPNVDLSSAAALLSPYRNEVVNKLTWMPAVEADADLDVIFYPYWPSPPRRRATAPPAVIFVHDLAFRQRPGEVPWQQRLYLGALMPRAVATAAAIVVPSMVTRADLLANYPRPGLEGRVHVIPEGPTPLPAPARDPKGGRAPGYLLAVGTIEHRKNYRRLLAAYQMVRSRLPGAPPLVVVGRVGWDCRAEVEILRTSPGVEYLEHVSDLELAGLYANAAALLFPSLYEGFGLPLLDAMNRGVPALIGRTGALPELAAGAALEVDAEDLESIAGGIHRLVENAELRLELARLGRERASGFGWDRAGAEVVALLRQVATEAGGQQ